jgi:hypothetical protein
MDSLNINKCELPVVQHELGMRCAIYMICWLHANNTYRNPVQSQNKKFCFSSHEKASLGEAVDRQIVGRDISDAW